MTSQELVILIADDDGHASLVRQALADAGLPSRVERVRTGQEALDFVFCLGAFSGRRPDTRLLLLLDINVPPVDGVEELRRLRSDPASGRVPVVVLGTTDDPREVSRCYDLGCNGYIAKPVESNRFAEAIRRLGRLLAIARVPSQGNGPGPGSVP